MTTLCPVYSGRWVVDGVADSSNRFRVKSSLRATQICMRVERDDIIMSLKLFEKCIIIMASRGTSSRSNRHKLLSYYYIMTWSRPFGVLLYSRYMSGLAAKNRWRPQETLRRGVKKLAPTMSWQRKHDVSCTTTAAEWSIESRTHA